MRQHRIFVAGALLAAVAMRTAAAEAFAIQPLRIQDDSRWNPTTRNGKQKAQWKRERKGRKS